MSELLQILENEVQVAALSFMGIVYIFRLIWLYRFASSKERTYAAGDEKAGIVYSMMNVAMPWAMESTRKRPGFYGQFVVFHMGVIAAIGATFIIPYWPELFKIKAVVRLFQLMIAAAFMVCLMRLYRRIVNRSVRLISTMDDYFSLVMVLFFLAAGFLAIPNKSQTGEWPLIAFFGITAFLLIYVPFSKICHYLYYPFTRYFLGRTMGHRGGFPGKKMTKGSGSGSGRC
jgi:hypothetical protein